MAGGLACGELQGFGVQDYWVLQLVRGMRNRLFRVQALAVVEAENSGVDSEPSGLQFCSGD